MMKKIYFCVVVAILPTCADAQGLLGNIFRPKLQADSRNSERRDILNHIISDINVTPDHACTLPQSDIESWLVTQVNREGLMDNVSRTVFHEDLNATPVLRGYDALMQRTREESARLSARNKAIYEARETGGQTPVGEQTIPEVLKYKAEMFWIKATNRINNGLNCAADVQVGALRFPVTYNVVLDANAKDGWKANLQAPTFSEAAALADSAEIRVHYGDHDLTLMQARQQSQLDLANRNASEARSKQQKAAQAAYQNSPAGRAAAYRQRQAMVVKQRACEAHGGTWGVNTSGVVIRVDAKDVNGLGAALQSCYFLGR